MDEALAIAGRVAIVTGAGNGLGRAESLALARAGALLVLNDLPGDAVQAVAGQIAAEGAQAVVAAGDVADWATGERLLATALEQYGRLDILVNNAGVLRDRMVFTMSPDEWDLVIRVHLRGHFVTTRLATAYWRDQRRGVRGARRRGRGDGSAPDPFGVPRFGHARWHVDAGLGGRGARPCFRGPGARGRVLVRGHARAGHRDHRVP